ncbi:MAG: hypothetical protein PVG39_07025 [Desulfobacteraceae bacterium]|jgi:hypothetical protein
MVYFFYNIAEQIEKANELYSLYGSQILKDNKCSSMLKEFNAAIEDSWKLMKELGVVNICSVCADEKPGGCCHFGIETCYTNMLILMNLLLGVKIPEQRTLDNNCLFAGEHGCLLKARFKTCIHHLCPEIKDSLNEYDMFRLRAITNYEIRLGAQLETAIREWIRDFRQV